MIRQLSPELIHEIAAGEVVTSPVDVVKEILENALDAKATRLELELLEGGLTRICLTDNGKGIPSEELVLSVKQHNTSKLDRLDKITSLGFRGEGLYALQFAATLSIVSRPSEQLGGAKIIAEQGNIQFETLPADSGTSVEISNLFKHLPARRYSLEPAAESLRKITQLLTSYLLHYPHLKLKLVTDNEVRWHYAGGSFKEAAKFLWGTVTANRLLKLKINQNDLILEGLISRPELTRPRKDRLLLAVNGRPIAWEERWLKAVFRAYAELLPVGHYPVAILNLTVAAETVLVNTSPNKRTVRFLEEDKVLEFLEKAIRDSLAAHPLAVALPQLKAFEQTETLKHSFPKLSYLSSYQDLYLIAQAQDKLWIIDQHAAHERIIYEELERRYKQEAALELSHAELIPLTPQELTNFQEREQDLAALGIKLEPFGGGQWRLRCVPAFLAGQSHLLAEIIKESLQYDSLEKAWRRILGRLACLPAIKAGHPLSNADAQALLDALQACHMPWSCPHGRPTVLSLSEAELAKRFGRSGSRQTSQKILNSSF